MSKNQLKINWLEFQSVAKAEFGHIFKDGGVLLIMVFAIIIYGTLYSWAYNNEVLRDIPIAVVDNSMTASSRRLTTKIEAAPNVRIAYKPGSMAEAEELFYDREVFGVVFIPEDYERKLLKGGEQVKVGLYADGSYLLMYRQAYSDIAKVIMNVGAETSYVKLLSAGINEPQAKTIVNPVEFTTKHLFNPYLGYGSFVMPAILMIIVQQTLLLGIGMIGGTWREFGVYRKLIHPGERRLSTVPVVLGKTVVYLSIYAVTLLYILGVHYRLFNYPMHAPFLRILWLMVPYVLACIFLGIAVSTLFRYRENSVLFMLWTSIPMLLISGASIPKEAIPAWMYGFGKIFPSSSGVEGFVRLQTMGAGVGDVRPEVVTLWVLCAVYFVLACVGIRMVLRRVEREEEIDEELE